MNTNQNQSIKDRLKNLAQASGIDYNYCCIQFMQERFLARIEKSTYRNHFILKGALLLLAYDLPQVRPSKDIDFLGEKISNHPNYIRSAIREIAGIDLNDGVIFYDNEIEVDEITKDADYIGLRVKLKASVGGDQHRIQIDIGFGDVMEYGPVKISYPSMLDFEPPMILAYSLESAIAEKLQAIVSLGLFGSRMKDFYDIWFLLNNRDLDKERLRKAIESTFKNRNTDIYNINLIFKDEFINDAAKAIQWKAFLKRIKLNQDVSFESIMLDMKRFFRNEVNLIS